MNAKSVAAEGRTDSPSPACESCHPWPKAPWSEGPGEGARASDSATSRIRSGIGSPAPDLLTAAESPRALDELNRWLAQRTAPQRVEWALGALAGEHALSSSFGAQSALALHLVTRVRPDIPVILIDTGYLFPETYRFADRLAAQLNLNLKVFRPQLGAAWMEARHGRLWEQGMDGLAQYNALRKLEPMQRALDELGVRTWIAGIRRAQSESRAHTPFLELRDGRWKLHPLADWSDCDVADYLQEHDLPWHPLWHHGYPSIGDRHTTRRLQAGERPQDTRFFGLKRECGLHYDDAPRAASD